MPKAKKASTKKRGEKIRERSKKDDDVYGDEGRDELLDDDELTVEEEGFMKGYELADKFAKCARCGKTLPEENYIEKEISGEHYKFCSSECAARFEPEIE